MPCMRVELRLRQNHAELAAGGVACLERAAIGVVALEMRCIDRDAVDRAARAQPDDDPIVPWTSPAACFPTVAHVRSAARHDQVLPRSEEHVARGYHQPAVLDCGQIDIA